MSTRQRIGRRAAEGIKANPWERAHLVGEGARTLDLQLWAEVKSLQSTGGKLTTMGTQPHAPGGRFPASGAWIARSRIRLTFVSDCSNKSRRGRLAGVCRQAEQGKVSSSGPTIMLSRGGGWKGGSVRLEWQPCQNGREQRHNHSSIALAAEGALSNQHSIAALCFEEGGPAAARAPGSEPISLAGALWNCASRLPGPNETEKVCPWARDGLRYGDCGGHFDRRLALGRIGSRSDAAGCTMPRPVNGE